MTTFQDGNPSASREFRDRRRRGNGASAPGVERRQFGDSYMGLSSNARELALAIDAYKLRHRRRFITCEELLSVIEELGYAKAEPALT